jgi:hypothetical protein
MATLSPFCGIVNDLLSSATRRAVFGSAVSRPDFLMKTPRDLADTIKGRNSGQLIRQTLRLPRAEARKRRALFVAWQWLFFVVPGRRTRIPRMKGRAAHSPKELYAAALLQRHVCCDLATVPEHLTVFAAHGCYAAF